MTFPWSWHTSNKGEEMVEAMALFLSRGGRQLYGKIMEALTPNGVFIGFPNGLKWLELTKDLGHLI